MPFNFVHDPQAAKSDKQNSFVTGVDIRTFQLRRDVPSAVDDGGVVPWYMQTCSWAMFRFSQGWARALPRAGKVSPAIGTVECASRSRTLTENLTVCFALRTFAPGLHVAFSVPLAPSSPFLGMVLHKTAVEDDSVRHAFRITSVSSRARCSSTRLW